VGIPAGKVTSRRHISQESGDFSAIFTARERRFPTPVAKVFFGSGFLAHQDSCVSAVVENHGVAIAEGENHTPLFEYILGKLDFCF
jgi:hypothetical protein